MHFEHSLKAIFGILFIFSDPTKPNSCINVAYKQIKYKLENAVKLKVWIYISFNDSSYDGS